MRLELSIASSRSAASLVFLLYEAHAIEPCCTIALLSDQNLPIATNLERCSLSRCSSPHDHLFRRTSPTHQGVTTVPQHIVYHQQHEQRPPFGGTATSIMTSPPPRSFVRLPPYLLHSSPTQPSSDATPSMRTTTPYRTIRDGTCRG